MKKTLTLALALTVFAICHSQDSSFVDLGRIQLRKDFVQTITIRGTDLEKIPAASLQEAINVWLYGVYSQNSTLVFAVDGHIITDINLYSIHDIEEVQLVQNAAIQLNGALFQQQLVLVKTKKKNTQGTDFRIAGQSALIIKKVYDQANDKTSKGDNSFYHQYFLSARHQSGNINAGASLGFLRDVNYIVDTFLTKQSPRNIERLRFNSYLDWKINQHHTLLTKLNLARQTNDRNMEWYYDFVTPPATDKTVSDGKDFNFEAEATLHSGWAGGLSNTLTAAYSGFGFEQNTVQTSDYPNGNPFIKKDNEVKTNNLLVSNSFRWLKTTSGFSFSPAMNMHFRYMKEHLDWETFVTSTYHSSSSSDLKKLLVTPSFDMAYKNALNLQLGILTDLSKDHIERLYPYVSFSASLSELTGQTKNFDWKIYTSYGRFDPFYDHAYSLRGLNEEYGTLQIMNDYPYSRNDLPNLDHFNWQFGTDLWFWKHRINLAYNFEKRTYPGTYTGSWGLFYELTHSKTNDIRIGFHALKTGKSDWLSTIHFTSIKNETDNNYYYGNYNTGSLSKNSWSGGWNNRFQSRKLFFGFDLILQLDKEIWNYWSGPNGFMQYRDLLSLHNAFLGYQLASKNSRNAELYITARNPFQDNDYMLYMETRSFYGIGFKVVL